MIKIILTNFPPTELWAVRPFADHGHPQWQGGLPDLLGLSFLSPPQRVRIASWFFSKSQNYEFVARVAGDVMAKAATSSPMSLSRSGILGVAVRALRSYGEGTMSAEDLASRRKNVQTLLRRPNYTKQEKAIIECISSSMISSPAEAVAAASTGHAEVLEKSVTSSLSMPARISRQAAYLWQEGVFRELDMAGCDTALGTRQPSHLCHCDIKLLFDHGCQCGGL